MSELKDITPAEFRCAMTASCPAVVKKADCYVIIGRHVAADGDLKGRVGHDEAAVEIPAVLLESALRDSDVHAPTDDPANGGKAWTGEPPEGCSCHPETRPPVCQHEHATLHCNLAWARSRIAELEARLNERDAFLASIGAWMDFVNSLPPLPKE